MVLNLNPQVRSNPIVAQSTLRRVSSPTLNEGVAEMSQKYPGFAPFTTNGNQFLNAGELNYDALMLQLRKRYSNNYSAQISYTYANSRGNTSGSGAPASNFQVLNDMRLDLNEGPSDFDTHHNLTSMAALNRHVGGRESC